jgi:hypothetical protein
MSADIVTQIGVAGCALLGPAFLFAGLRDWWRGRETPERRAELERIEEIMRKWSGYEPPADSAAEPDSERSGWWAGLVSRILRRPEPAAKTGTSRPSQRTS